MKNKVIKGAAFILALVFALAALTGCGKSQNSGDSGYAYTDVYREPAAYNEGSSAFGAASMKSAAAYDYAYEEAALTEVPAAAEPEPNAGSSLPANRKIIRNADVTVQTLEYEDFIAQLEQRVAAIGGYVESSNVGGNSYNTKKSNRTAYFTVRVPSERLDEFLDTACEGGYVTAKSIYTNDVTASYTDIEARLAALRTERETLMGLLEKAEKMEDVITIYDRLTDVNYEIESYEGRIRSYDEQIAYSSVSMTVKEVTKPTQVEPETRAQELKRRFKETCEDLWAGALDSGVSFIVALPVLLVWALIIFIVVIIVKRIVKKKIAKRKAKKEAKEALAKAAEKPAENNK